MKKLKTIVSLLMCLLLLLAFSACTDEESGVASGLPEGFAAADGETDFVCIQMNTGKCIVVELYPDVAPETVKNFKKLVSDKFYDGLIFHRVIKGFMIQGGCPEGTGFGGPGWEIKGEFSSNGFENNLKHTRGVLSMARSQAPDSAGSQFFIMHKAAPHLDGDYAAFGNVVSGMDVVDEIAGCLVAGETPVEKQIMEKVFFVESALSVENKTAE